MSHLPGANLLGDLLLPDEQPPPPPEQIQYSNAPPPQQLPQQYPVGYGGAMVDAPPPSSAQLQQPYGVPQQYPPQQQQQPYGGGAMMTSAAPPPQDAYAAHFASQVRGSLREDPRRARRDLPPLVPAHSARARLRFASSRRAQAAALRRATVSAVFPRLSFWRAREEELRAASPFGRLPGWHLAQFIVKANDNLRQEQLAMQARNAM